MLMTQQRKILRTPLVESQVLLLSARNGSVWIKLFLIGLSIYWKWQRFPFHVLRIGEILFRVHAIEICFKSLRWIIDSMSKCTAPNRRSHKTRVTFFMSEQRIEKLWIFVLKVNFTSNLSNCLVRTKQLISRKILVNVRRFDDNAG